MEAFTAGGDTLALETASAVRSASQAVDRLRSHGAEGCGLSAGALDVLARLSTATDQGLSIGELARAAGVSSRNVTGLVDTLGGSFIHAVTSAEPSAVKAAVLLSDSSAEKSAMTS
ncbi:hypothetical protein [Streptomyces sp. 3211.6]|uniref:hypothetical protein n=1 Tax=Streptomyces sp. 3211.6 TaxID=1938845 RepID=UPI001651762D|nr:hypothetical protein [Streptomyces sp. 3211.6]